MQNKQKLSRIIIKYFLLSRALLLSIQSLVSFSQCLGDGSIQTEVLLQINQPSHWRSLIMVHNLQVYATPHPHYLPPTNPFPLQLIKARTNPNRIHISSTVFLRVKDGDFSFQNNPKDLDLSSKTELDLLDCLGRVKLVLLQNFIGLI